LRLISGIHTITVPTWLKEAAIDDGVKPGVSLAESAELREANKRIRLLGQEVEVLRLALPQMSQGSILEKGFTCE